MEQSKLFIETAREIGADEEKSAADALIGRLAKIHGALAPSRTRCASRRSGNEGLRGTRRVRVADIARRRWAGPR